MSTAREAVTALDVLEVTPRPSVRLGVYLCAVHGAALAVLPPLPLPAAPRVALALVLIGSLAYSLWAQVLRRVPWSVVGATWGSRGIEARLRSGRSRSMRLSGSSYIGFGLVILNLRDGPLHRRTLVLTADSIDSDVLRRLRVRLRLIGTAAA
jgi:toxin CptA